MDAIDAVGSRERNAFVDAARALGLPDMSPIDFDWPVYRVSFRVVDGIDAAVHEATRDA